MCETPKGNLVRKATRRHGARSGGPTEAATSSGGDNCSAPSLEVHGPRCADHPAHAPTAINCAAVDWTTQDRSLLGDHLHRPPDRRAGATSDGARLPGVDLGLDPTQPRRAEVPPRRGRGLRLDHRLRLRDSPVATRSCAVLGFRMHLQRLTSERSAGQRPRHRPAVHVHGPNLQSVW